MPGLLEFASGNYYQLWDQFVVGRSLECSHIIEDISISRKHCSFTVNEDKWFITDLSVNGLFVNDTKLPQNKAVELKNNDCIQISNHLFGFKFEPESNSGYTDSDTIVVEPDTSVIVIPDTPGRVKAEPLTKPAEVECANNLFDDELTCSVCAELFINAVTLNCQHTFCELCIFKWQKNSKCCPICRHKIKTQIPCLTVNNMVALVYEKKSPEEKELRKTTIEARIAEFNAVTAPAPATANRGRGRGRGRGAAGRLSSGGRRGRQTNTRVSRGDRQPTGAAIEISSDSDSSDFYDSGDLDDSFFLDGFF